MIQNPDAQVFNLFPTALYVTNYRADTSVFTKYFDEQEMEKPNGGYGVISKNSYIDKDTHKKTSIINNFKLTQESVSLISFDDCEKQIKLVDKEYNINDQTNIICFTARSKFFHEEEKNLDNDRNYSVSKLKKKFKYFISNN